MKRPISDMQQPTGKQHKTMQALAELQAAFAEQPSPLPENAELNAKRADALARVQADGLPDKRHEDWKYTSLAGFAQRSATYLKNPPLTADAKTLDELLNTIPTIDGAYQIVFANGVFLPERSTLPPADSGVQIEFLTQSAEIVKHIFDKDQDAQPLPALNAAFISDGALLTIAEGVQLQLPLHIIYLSDGQPSGVQVRFAAKLGSQSQATIIEHHVSSGDALTNAVSHYHCAESAVLQLTRLQAESTHSMHFTNQSFELEAEAQLNYVSIDNGAELARKDLHVRLHGERAHADLAGLFISDGQRHVDNHIQVDHLAANTTSTENYRGILSDSARGVFNGKIIVHSGADGTDAQMNNRNLLLSELAEINTKPELEIYTDDVKCAHGSTTGQLDQNALFYLRARGIPMEQARKMLVTAFAQSIIDPLHATLPQLADFLTDSLHQALDGGA